jgi:hypothetical protein
MSTPALPPDYWHTFVYVNFGWLCCGQCEVEPDLQWAWGGLKAEGEAAVEQFTIRAVEHLKNAGWIMHADQPCCPACAAKLRVPG